MCITEAPGAGEAPPTCITESAPPVAPLAHLAPARHHTCVVPTPGRCAETKFPRVSNLHSARTIWYSSNWIASACHIYVAYPELRHTNILNVIIFSHNYFLLQWNGLHKLVWSEYPLPVIEWIYATSTGYRFFVLVELIQFQVLVESLYWFGQNL